MSEEGTAITRQPHGKPHIIMVRTEAIPFNIRQSGIHVVFNAPGKFQNSERGIEFCRSRKIISVGCLPNKQNTGFQRD